MPAISSPSFRTHAGHHHKHHMRKLDHFSSDSRLTAAVFFCFKTFFRSMIFSSDVFLFIANINRITELASLSFRSANKTIINRKKQVFSNAAHRQNGILIRKESVSIRCEILQILQREKPFCCFVIFDLTSYFLIYRKNEVSHRNRRSRLR